MVSKPGRSGSNDIVKNLSNKISAVKADQKVGGKGFWNSINNATRNRRNYSIAKRKLKAMTQLAKSQQSLGAKLAQTAQNIGVAGLTNDAVRNVSSKNSYQNSLNAWLDNMGGNPDTSKGDNGQTQSSSTTELGG